MSQDRARRLRVLLEPMIGQNWQGYWEPIFARESGALNELCGHGRFAAQLMLALENVAACDLGLFEAQQQHEWQSRLAQHLRRVFDEVGGFAWTGHHGCEGNRAVDTNEVASVVDYLCRLRRLNPDLPPDVTAAIDELVPACCDLILGARADEQPGALLKSAGHETEILNTTATGAAALLTAAADGHVAPATARAVADAACQHLMDRFGRHVPGWWPYAESLDDAGVVLGISLNYQAVTLLGFARLLPDPAPPEARAVVQEAATALAQSLNPNGSCRWLSAEERLDHRGYPQVCCAMALLAAARLLGAEEPAGAAERLLGHVRQQQFRRGKFAFEAAPQSTGPSLFRDSTVQTSLFYLSTALLQSLGDDDYAVPYPG